MRGKLIGAAVLVVLAATLAVYGHLMPDPKQVLLAQKDEAMLKSRQRHIDCAELLDTMHNNQMQLAILDARDEADYNVFHLIDSRRLPKDAASAAWLKGLPTDSIKVVVSNDESLAEAAWNQLMLAGVPHVYILAGGINHWLDMYGNDEHPTILPAIAAASSGDDILRHKFAMALGCRIPAADPELAHVPKFEFARKVLPPKPITKMSGGCGG